MRKRIEIFGGAWVLCCLLVRCKFRTRQGSYLHWRNETAFGKDGQFDIAPSERRRSVWSWARWAWSIRQG